MATRYARQGKGTVYITNFMTDMPSVKTVWFQTCLHQNEIITATNTCYTNLIEDLPIQFSPSQGRRPKKML